MVISFYSYKGGVGRTQLCANIAAYFYYQQGKRVLLWDWDFEAPGLHYFFNKKNNDINKKGTLELFEDYVIYMRKNASIRKNNDDTTGVKPTELKFITIEDNIIELVNKPGTSGCIDLLPAGNYSSDFSSRINNFDWYDFYTMMDGVTYVELLKNHLKDLNYDYILIDSRTGISDYSGICNIQLPDINVMVIAATMQNFEGCKTIIEKIQNSEYLKIKKREAKILPVLSRIDLSGPKYNEWAKRFGEYFAYLIQKLDKNLDKEFLPEVFDDVYYKDTFLPYTTAISAGENIFTHDSTISKTDYSRPFLNIAGLIENLNTKYGYIEFYKKIDEASWNEYALRAERDKDGRKAAIAYNQIGIKQKETADQIKYFEKAIKHDNGYTEAIKNLNSAYANLDNYEKNIPSITENYLSATGQSNASSTPKTRNNKVLVYVVISVIISLGILLYLKHSKNGILSKSFISSPSTQQLDSFKNVLAQLKGNDTTYFSVPTASASAYFDSIRNMGKPIGIDISSRNQIYDWSKVKNYGISFIFIKATEGRKYKNPNYSINWLVAKKSKLIRGAYHFYAINLDPDQQADNFIANVKLEDDDLPPIVYTYAFEDPGSVTEKNLKKLQVFLDRITLNYGAKPILFMSPQLAEFILRKDDFSCYSLWQNQPGNDEKLYKPRPVVGWSNWSFWQFSITEHFDGIVTQADTSKRRFVNVSQFNGTGPDLLKFTLKPTPGRNAVMLADSFLTNEYPLFISKTLANKSIKYNNDIFTVDEFKKIKFNWDVELINQSFASLNSRALYGKGFDDLYALFMTKGYIITNKKDLNMGDVVFYDFNEKKGIQACGIVYKYDSRKVYSIEASDANGKLKVRTVERNIEDIKAIARITDVPHLKL